MQSLHWRRCELSATGLHGCDRLLVHSSDMESLRRAAAVCFTERQLREVAWACFTNAQEFHEEACLLREHHHVRSIALAILGGEEFAKAIVFTVAAFRPDEHALLSKALFAEKVGNRDLFRHDVKHVVTDLVDGVLIQTDDGIDHAEWASGFSLDAYHRFRMRLLALVRHGLKALIPSRCAAQEQVKALNHITYGAAPSTLKNLAFYVEIDCQGNIVWPSQLQPEQADGEIGGLEYFLETFSLLPELLQHDEQWQPFADSIRQQLPRNPLVP
jgi:AbiV family abortive infection protein